MFLKKSLRFNNMKHIKTPIIFRYDRKYELQNCDGHRIGEIEFNKGKQLICRHLNIGDESSEVFIEIGWVRNIQNDDYYIEA
jgi:hypothetical protein